jgi:hypothetical protein
MDAGRAAVQPCQERFHDQADSFGECVRYVDSSRQPKDDTQPWWRLGAYEWAAVAAERAAQLGDADAEPGARLLAAEAAKLEAQLRISDEAVCRFLETPCPAMREARRLRLAEGEAPQR